LTSDTCAAGTAERFPGRDVGATLRTRHTQARATVLAELQTVASLGVAARTLHHGASGTPWLALPGRGGKHCSLLAQDFSETRVLYLPSHTRVIKRQGSSLVREVIGDKRRLGPYDQ
jgi:hypothetical protein